MAVETSFLSAVSAFLSGLTSVTPKPKVNVVEPAVAADLPAVVLSLERAERPASGMGDASSVRTGALAWSARIDLASPFLPDDPGHTFSLLSQNKKQLTLPHGGLVRRDGTSDGPLGAADLQVKVAGADRPVVSGTPSGLQVRPDAGTGVLSFATELPATGLVEASYFLGQWERRVEPLNGVLRLDVCAANLADAQAVADGVLDALLGPEAKQGVPRLIAISLQSLGSIGLPEAAAGNARRRQARLSFRYERDVDRPESAGGVIQRIPVTANVGLAEE